ncbi:manganese/zinc/iron transport system permease protein [Alteribacillus persepolensis]|uniref:Manganese transport system membrane protein MntC n=1 Tax=Alteribacillus persepolensis TaxID=568899 RepID=A0A1G8FKR7_9BACI|nr:metal ABC transporter permease [Alteribacillus persepolensis]SDH82697.1 manganese/zinc/iron transport system permease protein [Alteribacillus persepolensis]
MQEWSQLLTSANLQWVLLGTLFLGMASGVVGSFVLLRKESLVGDAMAHAALPGICLGFLLYGRELFALMAGAALTGLLAIYAIRAITAHSKLKQDAAIGIVLSVFFGFGIVLLTYITNGSAGNKAGLDEFIFGQAASLVFQDVQILLGTAIVLLMIALLFFKELKLLTFDPLFAGGIGLPVSFLHGLLSSMVVLIVITGIQAVGVVLMAALLITPAIAARYWTEKLGIMAMLAGIIGGVSGVFGAMTSAVVPGLPTGPVIVVCATIVFVCSFLFAPARGLVFHWLKNKKRDQAIWQEQVLRSIYELLETRYKEHSTSLVFTKKELSYFTHLPPKRVMKAFHDLQKQAFIGNMNDGYFYLTDAGFQKAYQSTLQYRVENVYLMYESQLGTPPFGTEDRDESETALDTMNTELRHLLKKENLEPISFQVYKTTFKPYQNDI